MSCANMTYNAKRKDFFPCGKCDYCLRAKSRDWYVRSIEEQKEWLHGYFLTCTFDDDNLEPLLTSDDGLKSLALNYLKTLNQDLADGKSAHFLVCEAGGQTLRPHYHIIFFTNNTLPEYLAMQSWPYGRLECTELTATRMAYAAGYVNKADKNENRLFRIISKKYGYGYITRMSKFHRMYDCSSDRDGYTLPDGREIPLPRYYRERIYSPEQRSYFRAKKLDKRLSLERQQDVADPSRFYNEYRTRQQGVKQLKINKL